MVWQEPQHPRISIQRGWALRSVAVGHGLRLLLWLHGWGDRSVDALPVPGSYPDFPVDWQAWLQLDDRHGGRGDQIHESAQRRGTQSTLFRLLCARRKSLAAPAQEGMERQVQREVRHGL